MPSSAMPPEPLADTAAQNALPDVEIRVRVGLTG